MKIKQTTRFSLAFPLAMAIAAMLCAPSVQAANISWSGATDVAWNTNTNWVGDALPLSNDSLFFDAPGAGGLSLNNNLTSGSFTVASIIFNSTAGAYVIGDGTATANLGNTFVLGAPAATAAFTVSVTNASINLQTINTPFTLTTGQTRTFIGTGDITLAGNIGTTTGALNKSGGNTLTLSGTNTYTGQTSVGGGVLRLDSANAVPGGIGSTGGTSNINFNSGVIGLGSGDFTRALGNSASTVQFGGNGGWAAFGANRSVNLGGASASVTWVTATTGLNNRTLILGHATATHTVDFQNPLDLTNGGRTVQADDGSAAIDGIISGNITGVALGNLTKAGFGTLALTGAANSYVGTTTINGGTLLVNGTKSGTGTVTVNAGAALGGTGSVSGAVTASASGRLDLTDGVVGNLSLGSTLTLSGTAATPNLLLFDLGNGAGGTDKIITTGAHTAGTANGVQVHLNQLSGTAVDPGTYTLIQGGAVSTFTGYTLATTRASRNLYSGLGASGNDLQVTVAAGTAGDTIDNHYWQGDTSVWNTAQWYSDAAGTTAATAPGYSSNVRFGTTTAASLTNSLGEDYEINSLTVDAGLAATSISGNMLTIGATIDNNNAAGNGITVANVDGTTISSRVGLGSSQTWTVDTAAALTVSGAVSDFGNGHALTKAGAGTLTLTGVNTFSGPLTVSGGTLAIGGAGQLNNGLYGPNIVNNGILSYGSSAGQTLNGIISGTGSLTKSGGSTLTLNNGGTFTGGATISGGSLSIGTANLVNPLGPGTTTVNTGSTYALSATLITAPLVLNGGTVTAGNSFGSTINGPVTLDANSTISISGNLTINSNITGTGGLTKTLAAFVPLNGAVNDYAGPTVISGGGLTIKSSLYGNDTAKWIPDNITVNSGAALVMNVGGAGEFSIGQAGLMFSQLGGVVNNNGLRAGSVFGVDLRTAGGSFTISDDLIDSSGPGGGAVGFRIVGNGTVGAATVELTGNNTYSGLTVVDRNGTIKVSSLNSVDIANLDPGLPLATSSLGRPTTVANGTIQLGSNVSFQGGSLTYTGTGETTDRVLNLGGANGTTYRLDQSGTGLLKFTSPFTITDNRGVKTIELQGSTAGAGEISSSILNGDAANPNRLTKAGTGTWTLSGANLFVGITTVNGGALVLANANALNGGIGATGGLGALTFNGGVIGLAAGNFSRPLAAANTVGAATFTGAGGWAAYGADRTVNLGGALASIAWGTASTGLNGQTLILGNATATHTVEFQNPLVAGGSRTVRVDNGAAAVDGIMSGAITGNFAQTLTKSGDGTLLISGTTDNGSLILNASAGVVILGKTVAGPHAVAGIGNIATGATVQLSGTGGNQIFNGPFQTQFGLVNMSGGTLDLNGLNEGFDRLTGTGSVTNSLAATTSTLTLGTVDGSGSFGGALTDGAGVLALTKIGAGTLTLTGTNLHTGATTVSAGILSLGATGSVATTTSVAIAAGATFDTSGQAVYAIPAGTPVAFGINAAGSGTTGKLTAAGLDIANATVSYNITGTPDDPVYVLATYTTLTGAAFLSAPLPPAGYVLDYAYEGNKIALVSAATPYDAWATFKGLTGAPGFENGKTDDPDNDGKDNLYEFAFDGNPLSGASDGKVVGKVATVGGNQVLTLTLPVRNGATFSDDFGDELSALVDGVYYRIEGDETLVNFADTIDEVPAGLDRDAIQAGLPGLSDVNGDTIADWTYRTFRAPGTVSTVSKAFLRAKATETP